MLYGFGVPVCLCRLRLCSFGDENMSCRCLVASGVLCSKAEWTFCGRRGLDGGVGLVTALVVGPFRNDVATSTMALITKNIPHSTACAINARTRMGPRPTLHNLERLPQGTRIGPPSTLHNLER